MGYEMRRRLPETLARFAREIEGYAREYGLEFVPICFEMLDHDQLNEVASYGGFPTRYPHWKWGMDYEQLQKSYIYGLSKIYELVINNDPCYAYLMKSNSLVDQKLVMAHVCGHADFFKHNLWFAHTNRKMMDQMANHGTRMRRYAERHGHEEVEKFIDACLSIENLIDIHSPFVKRRAAKPKREEGEEEPPRPTPFKLRSKDYMDRYVNPPEFLEEQQRRMDEAVEKSKRFPEHPERDVMLFMLQHAPLERWQRDILGMLREEAYYFAPQAMTKIMNEGWACVVADTPVFTDAGLISMEHVVGGGCEAVGDGQGLRSVTDRNVIEDHETIVLTTGRGLLLEGSTNHRVLLADGVTWKRLDDLELGDVLRVAGGGEVWPSQELELGGAGQQAQAAAAAEGSDPGVATATAKVTLPARLDVALGELLGTLIGSGRIEDGRVTLRPEDLAQRKAFQTRCHTVFGVEPQLSEDESRVELHAPDVANFLREAVGLEDGHKVRERRLPRAILRSPRHVVRAFLRAYFDCDGWAGLQGVFLSTASESISRGVQLLLLNLGILSRRGMQSKGTWHLHISGASAARFAEAVGFDLSRKRAALEEYLRRHDPLKTERWEDVVELLEPGRATVYDITVEETHRYAAAGLINHNSFWHSKLMTEKILTDAEVIDYADHHAGTLGTRPGQLNPYKLGIELFRDIEDRWNKGKFGAEWNDCDDAETRRNWDKKLGLGREKIYEVRKIYNDVLFIDEFLTEEFAREQKMFTFEFSKQSGDYVIASREFKTVKMKLLDQLTNWGNPVIAIENGNYENRGELYLVHRHDGQDLQLDQAKDTVENLQMLWGRPVHIETQVEKRRKVMSYDGTTHSERTL